MNCLHLYMGFFLFWLSFGQLQPLDVLLSLLLLLLSLSLLSLALLIILSAQKLNSTLFALSVAVIWKPDAWRTIGWFRST